MPAAAAVLLAAGSGRRLAAGRPKALVPVGGRPLVAWSCALFAALPEFDEIVLVVPAGAEKDEVARAAGLGPRAVVVEGGARRRDSVAAGLAAIRGAEHVLVHDAARPLLSPALVRRVLEAARTDGAAVPGIGVADALVRGAAGRVAEEVPREALFGVQTPQGFRTELLREAHRRAPRDWDAPDDGAMVRALGEPVALVAGETDNLKVTWDGDVARAEAVLASRKGWETMTPRIGIGWDVHPLVAGRSFLLAGVEISAEFGPQGHSDGDPLAHAVADALLGAAALGDIGQLFPDTDPRWAGLAGCELLRRTAAHLAAHGFRPTQVDAVLVVDAPKIAPHREAIRGALAAALGLPDEAVSVKGKRTEGLGGLAGGKGVLCHAVATVTRSA
ncbi:MAG: 2-C-methyl-D-erythritol 4-phosphate cytidylyltransferase [Acidobacteria bacterium]|jgi:2-C-methyl-D-erythritol 4-phosphate cytidylyltransferase/2-C-methyl-D-erythritol 2,4-cyclodiphosphate synthase|nr:2-C-methyl-D-erythritol 4-phosphate cytidylyltransferase [Acidobacteriota bacterium]